MATKRIKAIIQFRRGNAAEWTQVNPILRAGEPGFELDEGGLKIGNGLTPWNELPYAGKGGSVDFPTFIQDPQDGQVLLYNAETHVWENYNLADENSIIRLEEEGLSLKGYKEASQGQMLVKDEREGLAWINPVSDASLQEYTRLAEEAAGRAGQSAVVAGNFAGEAIQAKTEVERKIWFGSMEEYNALETIYHDTIYIILHE